MITLSMKNKVNPVLPEHTPIMPVLHNVDIGNPSAKIIVFLVFVIGPTYVWIGYPVDWSYTLLTIWLWIDSTFLPNMNIISITKLAFLPTDVIPAIPKIGALVVGIGYLIAKMNENADATEKLTLEQESLNKQLEITKKLTDDNAKAIDYDTNIKLANAKKVGASDKELLRIQLDGYEAKGKANNKEIEDIQKTQSKSVNLTKEQNKRIQDLREQNLDLQRKGNVDIANSDADLANKQRELSKKAGEESAANKKKNKEEREAERKKDAEALKVALQAQKDAELLQIQEITKAIGDSQDKQAEANMTASEVEQRVVKDKYFGLIEAAKQQKRSEDEINVLQVQRTKELQDIKDKYRLQDDEKTAAKLEKTISDESLSFENRLAAIDTEQALFQKQLDDKLITEEQFNEKTKKLSDARVNIDKAEKAAKAANLKAVGDLLGNLSSLLGESTAAGKAAAVAQATISTFQAAQSAYASLSGIPVVGPALGAVAAGVAVSVTLALLAAINHILSSGAEIEEGDLLRSKFKKYQKQTKNALRELGDTDIRDIPGWSVIVSRFLASN